jgi:DNA-directed RNA polymerase specialized sigma subunit
MSTVLLDQLPKYNDPELLDGRQNMSFDTFFRKYVRRASIREFFIEKRGLKQYEIDGISHIEHVMEYLVNEYGCSRDQISAHDVYVHQEESGRKTSLDEAFIASLMEIMKGPKDIDSESCKDLGDFDPGLLGVEKEETAKELLDFMNKLHYVERKVFVYRFPDDEQLPYKKIGEMKDIVQFCNSCKYKRYVIGGGCVDDGFLQDQYRGAVRKLRRFIADNDLSIEDLKNCIGIVVELERYGI